MNEHEQTPVDEQLEARLAAMTTWTGSVEGEGGGPLARALATTANDTPAVARTIGFLRGLSKRQIAAVLVVAAGGLLVAGMVVPFGGVRSKLVAEPSRKVASDITSSNVAKIRENIDRVRVLQAERKYKEALQVTDQILFLDPKNETGLLLRDVLSDMQSYAGVAQLDSQKSASYSMLSIDSVRSLSGLNSPESDFLHSYPKDWPTNQTQVTEARQIIRRASVDVVASDVQVAFRKAQDLVKVELGEFVQESTLSGSGKAMSGRVVLRLEPSRLAEVMQATRGLGELAAEQTGGDDVTERLTDLDAQIRNEQRVEKEMLELFDLRKDAPLKEVLDLREQLARVRGNIERMQASKSQMGRLVSLATLTLTIRPEPDVTIAPPVVEETPSFGARFSQEIGRSWDRATNNLVSSAGWAVETVIGGLPTWTVLGVTGFVIWRVVRKRQTKT